MKIDAGFFYKGFYTTNNKICEPRNSLYKLQAKTKIYIFLRERVPCDSFWTNVVTDSSQISYLVETGRSRLRGATRNTFPSITYPL